MKRIVMLLTVAVVASTGAVAGQDLRTEVLAAEQTRKAAALRPPEPDNAERIVRRVQEMFLGQPNGWFPTFDSVYSGGGFTVGAGYRRYYADDGFWDIKGLYSRKNYKQIDVGVMSRDHAGGRLALGARAGWRDATQVAYYGLGMGGSRDDRANFGFSQSYANAAIEARPHQLIVLEGAFGVDVFDLAGGEGSFPSIERRYAPAEVPGFFADVTYLRLDLGVAIDWRTSPGYSRRGGRYGVAFRDYLDRGDTFSFKTADLEVVQHIPILRENWVVSLRGRLETEIGGSNARPFFLLPSLGGGDTLRGYESFRFRDKHAVLMSAEWRWIPSRLALDMALFYDAGMVAPDRRGLRLTGLRRNVGAGVRFHGPTATMLRVEIARGDEGTRLVFAGGAAF